MLMTSPRHKRSDLELWRELEAADLLHYRHGAVASKLAAALDCVRRFNDAGPCYAGVSWGKDSVILAHLVARLADEGGPVIPLVFISVGDTLDQGCAAVRDHFLSLWTHPYHEIERDPGRRDDRGTRGKRLGFATANDLFGRRRLTGIRADESSGRRISARHLGESTANVCRPLLWWTAEDVFAMLAFAGLPAHQNYAMLGGGRWRRDTLRTAPVGGTRGDQFGRAEWEREYYGDVLRRLDTERSAR